jgi:uncharacterized membrane protein
MNRKSYMAFIIGLAAGILNLLFAAASIVGGGLSGTAGLTVIFILLYAACIINFIGACICRSKRALGGALMAVTALGLLIYVVWGLTNEAGAFIFKLMPELIIALIVVQLFSIMAAILCFTPQKAKQSEYYYERMADVPVQEEEHMGGIVKDLYKGNPPETDETKKT